LSACADEPAPSAAPDAPAVEEVEASGDDEPIAADEDAAPADDEPADDTWLVMIYGNADDEILEQDIFTDINEAELVGSSDEVTIVAQLDRYKGAFGGDNNWTGARRFLITQDDDLEHIGSELIENLG